MVRIYGYRLNEVCSRLKEEGSLLRRRRKEKKKKIGKDKRRVEKEKRAS